MVPVEVDKSEPTRPKYVLRPRDAPHTATVVIFHGLGDTGSGLVSAAQDLSKDLPHVKFVLPTAPTVSGTVNGGNPCTAWLDVDINSPADMLHALTKKPGRIDDAVMETTELLERESAAGVPPSRVVLMGFSMGGCLAAWTSLQMHVPLAGLVMLSSMVLGPAHMKLSETCKRTPIIYCHGTADTAIPIFAAQLTKQQLMDVGCEVRFYELPVGHQPSDLGLDLVRAFLRERLPPWLEPAGALKAEAEKTALPGALRPPGLDPSLYRIPFGARVTVRGLKSLPQHNGKEGEVVGHKREEEGERFLVLMDGQEKSIALRPQCLTQVVKHARLRDGAGCTVLDFDDEALVFRVRLDEGGGPKEAQQDEVRLPKNLVVRITGLTSERGKGYNDRFGRIHDWDDAESRYVLHLGSREKLKVKPVNALP